MIHGRLLRLAGPALGWVVPVAGMSVALGAVRIVFGLGIADLIARLLTGRPVDMGVVVLVMASVVGRAVLLGLREQVTERAAEGVRRTLRRRLLRQLADLGPAHRMNSGVTGAAVVDGVDGLEAYLSRYLPQLLVVLVLPPTTTALVATQAPGSAAVLAFFVAVAVLAPRWWDRRLVRDGVHRWQAQEQLTADYTEAAASIPVLRAFGAARRRGEQIHGASERLRVTTMRQLKVSLVDSVVGALSAHVGTAAALVVAAGALADGEATVASVAIVLLLAREAFWPVSELSTHWHAGYLGLTATHGLLPLLDAVPAVVHDGRHDAAARSGHLEVRAVSFTYPGTSAGVRDVSFVVPSGCTTVVVGPSGSGKSTIVRLVERSWDPDAGEIRLDSVDLRHHTAAALRRSISVVPQRPFVVTGTVRDNLLLQAPGADDEALEAVLDAAALRTVVDGLERGLDTPVGELGGRLSGGERQRLVIARSLLARPALLVLDEATSALDEATERHVLRSVAATGTTCLAIAHRPTVIGAADHVVRLDSGRLAKGPAS
ncbi:ABC transporter ATP-binding protein/permease [Aeromicrobium sp. CTD01-1L150]|uniref:ABC transporter ATP-binding protein/permease n=1 Tax=Aeromicrobium sp. CTD01-1L150 TaxID=3341830 RepID=UPI0035C14F18